MLHFINAVWIWRLFLYLLTCVVCGLSWHHEKLALRHSFVHSFILTHLFKCHFHVARHVTSIIIRLMWWTDAVLGKTGCMQCKFKLLNHLVLLFGCRHVHACLRIFRALTRHSFIEHTCTFVGTPKLFCLHPETKECVLGWSLFLNFGFSKLQPPGFIGIVEKTLLVNFFFQSDNIYPSLIDLEVLCHLFPKC